ncbi:MAG: hypothetical protein U5O16_25580 [Rhodococcus sp. (in: high G+C Gram-positive bacteria)]|uniref:hypothetical protein n=1 Tax=Rhodococcus sp. TaxID=1831 RepID=UPI002ADD148D|nr:hypothetical protein [Rhodococcus sp. (in: high G+C Gram-positive bacteria)]
MGFLDRVRPPAVHGVEHDEQADVEQPGIGELHAEQADRRHSSQRMQPMPPSAMTKAPIEPISGHGLGSMMW